MISKPESPKKLQYLPLASFVAAVVLAIIAGPAFRARARAEGSTTASGSIKVTHIAFNHEFNPNRQGRATHDALSIRYRYDSAIAHGPYAQLEKMFVGEVGAGEWIVDPGAEDARSRRNDSVLYLRETKQKGTNTTIMVRFEANNIKEADIYYVPTGAWPAVKPVKVSFVDKIVGDELNKFGGLDQRSDGSNPDSYTEGSGKSSSDYIQFIYSGPFPDAISRNMPVFTWWAENVVLKDGTTVGKMKLNLSGLKNPADPDGVNGHEFFNVLETPKAPWYEAADEHTMPWIIALRDVTNANCALAQTTLPDAGGKIAIYLFGWKGFTYNVPGEGTPSYYNFNPDDATVERYTQLQDYILVRDKIVCCYDQAAGVVCYMNLVGANATFQYKKPYGLLNPGDIVGLGRTNNPFGFPAVVPSDNFTRRGFTNHSYALYDGKVYDACGGPEVGTRSEVDHWKFQVDQAACDLWKAANPTRDPKYDFVTPSEKHNFKIRE